MKIIKNCIYKIFHRQPSFRNPDKWQKWFVETTMRDMKYAAGVRIAAEKKSSRR